MSNFVDAYAPLRVLSYGFASIPRTSTTITAVRSGAERRNQNRVHPLHDYTSPEAIRCWEDVEEVYRMWLAMGGPFRSFPFRDPMDCASRAMLKPGAPPEVFITDQVIGIGDGFQTDFQLQKTYTYGPQSYTRDIYKPVVSSVIIGLNALPANTPDPVLENGPYDYEVDRLTGVVTLDPAPADGLVVTWGGYFDVEVRFESDDTYSQIVQAFQVAGFADLSFHEVPPC